MRCTLMHGDGASFWRALCPSIGCRGSSHTCWWSSWRLGSSPMPSFCTSWSLCGCATFHFAEAVCHNPHAVASCATHRPALGSMPKPLATGHTGHTLPFSVALSLTASVAVSRAGLPMCRKTWGACCAWRCGSPCLLRFLALCQTVRQGCTRCTTQFCGCGSHCISCSIAADCETTKQ